MILCFTLVLGMEFQKKGNEEKDRVTVKKTQCLFTLPFKRLNLRLRSNICASSFVIIT